jgi:type 1 glutamine amidotransferase
LLLTLAAAWAPAAEPEKPPPDRVRVLLVTGVDHPAHDWKTTAPAVRAVLERDRRFEVRIVEDPEVLAADVLFDYDVVLLHFRNETPLRRDRQARANLVRFVEGGRGLVLIHFACGAFGDWPGFRDLAGRVWDGKNTHDPRGPFTVKVVNPTHPVTRGMHDFAADDELYIGLEGDAPVEVLATARSKVTGKDHPMAFVLPYGRGRVFHTPLGHDARAIEMSGTAELLRRGCAWAAGREP